MPESTADRLAQALRDANLYRLADRAQTGEFDDFRSEHAFPLVTLTMELKAASTPQNHRLVKALIEDVKAGRFDSTREEARAWQESDEGQEFMRQLMEEA